jgi:hypothetical protein
MKLSQSHFGQDGPRVRDIVRKAAKQEQRVGISVWYQSGVDFDQHPGYHEALTHRFAEIASPGTKVSLHGTSRKFNRGLAIADCTACTVAPKIGLVTLSRLAEVYILKSIATHHLESRVSGVHVVDDEMTEGELETNFKRPGPYIEKFKKAARAAIAPGADAIIPAEGLVAAMIAINHVHEIDQIPIIDSIAAAVLFAEFAVSMKQRAGLEPSRRFVYARPSPAALAALSGRD